MLLENVANGVTGKLCKRSTLDMMSEVARKILSKDPAAEAQRKKDVEEAQVAGGQYHGKAKQKNPKVRIGVHDVDACLPLWVQWV